MSATNSARITRQAIPQSELIKRLCSAADSENASKSHPIDFVGKFNRFAEHVAPLLGQTNVLFTEFTPHDETNHIASLFRIADELLGNEVIQNLNACESFLLAAALYGHDWGMAVSTDEKEAILTRVNRNNLALLDNEVETVTQFCSQNGIPVPETNDGSVAIEMGLDHWRTYVRITHAERANSRIRRFFSDDGDRQLGETLGILCASHWYEIKDVNSLSNELSLCGWTANLRALSIFIRLTDMFDIASNRTPYKLWKFVNPKNNFSSLEWGKHEAISPIVTARENDYRKVLIHGSTNDYRIEAAIRDMQSWVDEQFNENRLALASEARLNPKLGWTEWKIKCDGFEPVHIRFEFDRSRMFDVLSNEIYDGDQYVFVRELIQNCRDAIELRKAALAASGSGTNVTGRISIGVQNLADGNAIVSVSDNGLGMDEHVIKNYLSKLGKSYYSSSEFEKMSLQVNPISRFGVGILSCFMVADRIEIETQKDPSVDATSGYRVEIADYQQQFRIEKLPTGTLAVGTKVTVFVSNEKLVDENGDSIQLDIARYVATIAQGIGAEVTVTTDGDSAVVYPSNKRRPSGAENIIGVTYEYSRERVFESQDVLHIDEFLSEESKRIQRTFNGIKIRGRLNYFKIKEGWPNVVPAGFSKPGALIRTADNQTTRRIRFADAENNPTLSPSAADSNYSNLYLNGILMPEASVDIAKKAAVLPLPRITLEIDSQELAPTLSRRGLKSSIDLKVIAEDIYDREIKRLYHDEFMAADARRRMELLGEIMTSFHIDATRLKAILPNDCWPVITFSQEPNTQLKLLSQLEAESTKVVMPSHYCWQHSDFLRNGWATQNWMATRMPNSDEILAQFSSIGACDVLIDSFGNLTQRNHPSAISHLSSVLKNGMEENVGSILPVSYGGSTGFAKVLDANVAEETTLANELASQLISSLSFASFLQSASSHMGVIELSAHSYDGQTRTSKVTMNIDHPIGGQLANAIRTHENIFESLNSIQKGELNDVSSNYPLKGVIIGYHPQQTAWTIVVWISTYINKIAELSGAPPFDPSTLQSVLQNPALFAAWYE